MNTRRFMIPMLLMVTTMATLSCAASSRLRLTGSSEIPAAQSSVKVSTTDNGNTQINLDVEHLAPPGRVNPEATVYVVWVRGNATDAQPQNLGALKVDDNLKGSISAVTPLRAFELYVTAEPTQANTAPTGKTLLNTVITMK